MKHGEITLPKQSACDDNHKETHPSRTSRGVRRFFFDIFTIWGRRFGLPIFRRPLASLFHVLISTSSSVFLSTWPNHYSLASVIVSLMLDSPALALKVPDTNMIYPGIIGQQASGFEVRVGPITTTMFNTNGEMRLATSKSTLKNNPVVEVTGRSAPKPPSVINRSSAILCVVKGSFLEVVFI